MPERLSTRQGIIEYTLTRKQVKNLNLRINADGMVVISAPMRMPMGEIETFVADKAKWIFNNQKKILEKPKALPCRYTKEECLALFSAVSDRTFPLFEKILKGQKPVIRVREMKSRWGVCHIKNRTITLNMRLAEKPQAAMEYVVLHEYVHFLYPDHQAGFHAEMARLMPDYRQRRKLLRG